MNDWQLLSRSDVIVSMRSQIPHHLVTKRTAAAVLRVLQDVSPRRTSDEFISIDVEAIPDSSGIDLLLRRSDLWDSELVVSSAIRLIVECVPELTVSVTKSLTVAHSGRTYTGKLVRCRSSCSGEVNRSGPAAR